MTDQTTPAPPQISMEQRVDQYVRLRDVIKAKEAEHKEQLAPYKQTLEKLGNLMLDHLNQTGAESVKSTAGTVYKTVKRSASLEDADKFMEHVIRTEQWELLDRKANVSAVDSYVDENGVLPPGVKWSSVTTVGVRRA